MRPWYDPSGLKGKSKALCLGIKNKLSHGDDHFVYLSWSSILPDQGICFLFLRRPYN